MTGRVDACSSVQLNKSTGNVQHVFLNVVPVRVRCDGKETEVYAFLDQGSTACFCDRSLATELQLSGTSRQLKLQTLTETKSYRTVSAEMEVKGLFDGDWVQLPDVTVVDEIPVQPNVIPTSQRMIWSVRRILTSLMTERTLDDDQLHTFLLEAESILNSRPLTPITTDADGLEPLTPNHLLKLCPTGNFPPALPSDEHCYPKRRWKNVQYLADQFWKRWSREYLKTIIARQKWFKKKTNFQKDDVVLLVDDSIPRSQWRLGKVVNCSPTNKAWCAKSQ